MVRSLSCVRLLFEYLKPEVSARFGEDLTTEFAEYRSFKAEKSFETLGRFGELQEYADFVHCVTRSMQMFSLQISALCETILAVAFSKIRGDFELLLPYVRRELI